MDEEDYKPPWEFTQPGWYRGLLWRVRGCRYLDRLAELGKKVYEKNLDRDQAAVFWGEYGIRKKALEQRIPLSPAARAFIQKTNRAGDGLPGLGAWLYPAARGTAWRCQDHKPALGKGVEGDLEDLQTAET